ncbi:MAG: cytoplasmic protein [Nitrospira sp.]|nr:cytoplasmic protein [Candidatus Manganitrophaceae bacterium]HIL35651.1 cytoplasmic protein [Candidatus Manganitrophaceae bacterium]
MEKSYDQLSASLLYCNKCGRAMPVREKLLLILPDGELFDYLCQGCGSSVGSKTEKTLSKAAVVTSREISNFP